MFDVKPIATVKLRCKGVDFAADIHPPTPRHFSVPGGTIFGKFCWMKLTGHPLEQLFAGDTNPSPGLTEAELARVDQLLPKAALMALVKVASGEWSTHQQLKHVVSFRLTSLDQDPQVTTAAEFRKRCRYDVLRVVGRFISQHPARSEVTPEALKESGSLSRIYEDQDLEGALDFWVEREYLECLTLDPLYRIDVNRDEEIGAEIAKYDWEECVSYPLAAAAAPSARQYDAFICHASEDKSSFVDALARGLRDRGIKAWYDDFVLRIGDSLRREIDEGLAQSRFGIVVLSKSFFLKDWPQKELDGLDSLEVNGRKVILPIWHDLDRNEIQRYSPLLAGRLAAKSRDGMGTVISQLLEVLEETC